MSMERLDKMKNLEVRRTKKDGERRRTVSRQDELSKKMAAANSPSEIGKLAAQHGINEPEIFDRAKASPNFGQFRMVLGNRMRGILRRRKENPGMTFTEAAYPSKKIKGGKPTPKPKPKIALSSAKAAVRPTPKPKPKVTVKPKPKPEDPLWNPMSLAQAKAFAAKTGSTLSVVGLPFASDTAARAAHKKVGIAAHILVKGEGEDADKFSLVKLAKTVKATAKPAAPKPVVEEAPADEVEETAAA